VYLRELSPGETYRFELVVNSTDGDSRAVIAAHQLTEQPAALATHCENTTISTNLDIAQADVVMYEVSGVHGVTGLEATCGSFVTEGGTVLAMDGVALTLHETSVAAGGSLQVDFDADLADGFVDGSYAATLHVNGTDSVTGEPISFDHEIVILVDTLGPQMPVFTATQPEGDDTTIVVEGTAETGCTLELMSDGKVLFEFIAEDDGTFSKRLDMLSFGQHELVVRAVDPAGNATESQPVIFNSTVDNEPPKMEITIDGTQLGWNTFLDSATVTLDGEDANGMALIEYTFDGENWETYSQPIVVDQAALHQIRFRGTDNIGNSSVPQLVSFQVSPTAEVVGRHLFHNDSNADGNDPSANPADDAAIATDKVALLAGQTAGPRNVSNYSKGIVGVMVDIMNLANAAGLSADDFTCMIGNSTDPAAWTEEVTPLSVSVREGQGAGGADRVTLIFEDRQIEASWLEVTVGSTENTGLPSDDVFYFAHLAGDHDGDLDVDVADLFKMRSSYMTNSADEYYDAFFDFDKDGDVDVADLFSLRNSYMQSLAELQLQAAPPSQLTSAEQLSLEAIYNEMGADD